MSTAQVIDFSPAQFRRMPQGAQPAPATVVDDLADGIEAVHQLSNLAGFSERPRAFIFAIVTAAHKAGGEYVDLYDAELADLQGCSERTVRRQRADYQKEAQARRFGFLEIIEGDFDRGAGKNAPTRYRFHISGQIAQVVAEARQTEGWDGLSRKAQREAIARAAEEVFHSIPDARRQGRKRRRPRLIADEIETRRKVADTNLRKMRELAARLPPGEAERLMEDPGELRRWWLEMRAEMDVLFGLPPSEIVEEPQDNGGTGQFDRTPPATEAETVEPVRANNNKDSRTATPDEPSHPPESVAAFEALIERASGPQVRSVALELRAPDPGPPPEDIPDEDEVRERIAILAEAGEIDEQTAREFERNARDPLARRYFAARYLSAEGAGRGDRHRRRR